MHQKEMECLERWKTETLPEVKRKLMPEIEELKYKPIADFNAVVTKLGYKAMTDFIKFFNFETTNELDFMSDELKCNYATLIVSSLNSALPCDYPYIVALLVFDQATRLKMCVMDRNAIPGAHELVNPDIVPIVRIKNLAPDGKIEINFNVIDVEYFDKRDNLEDIYKL